MISLASKNLNQLIKQIAVEAVDAAKPSGIYWGTVLKTSPLQIGIGQKLILTAGFLELTNQVKEYQGELTIAGKKQQVTFHNELKKGDNVLLLRAQGGQKYVVLDKVVKE